MNKARLGIIDRIRGRPADRLIMAHLPGGCGLDEKEGEIVADEHYFEVRVSEMFIAKERQYWKRFVPLVLVVTEFNYDGQKRVVSRFVGNKTLKGVGDITKQGRIDQRNVRVAGPAPYGGDDISLFVGLFQVSTGNFVAELIDLVEEVSVAVGVGGYSAHLQMAKCLEAGIGKLLGLKDMRLHMGFSLNFSNGASSRHRPRNVYVACVNRPEDGSGFETQLRVSDDERLTLSPDGGNRDPLKDHDYCLVHLCRNTERTDYTLLPFYRYWKKCQSAAQVDEKSARVAFAQLLWELAVSPDLTLKHRRLLLMDFRARLDQELANCSPSAGERHYRGGEAVRRTAGALKTAARRLETSYIQRDMSNALYDLAQRWPDVSRASATLGRKGGEEAENARVNAGIKTIDKLLPNFDCPPEKLANALSSEILAG